MLSNITMGQYYPVDSKVHRLDPRIKLILTIVFIVIVFMAKTFLGYALILGFVWLTARLANVPFRMLLRGLKPLRIIIILTFLLNLFFTTGETIWVEFWVIRITKEGFLQADPAGVKGFADDGCIHRNIRQGTDILCGRNAA